MMNEYAAAYSRLKDVHKSAEGETYRKATPQAAEQFADIITAIVHCAGIHIEICGSWIWVTGNTYPHRDTLKNAGYMYSKSKKAWYHAGEGLKGKRRGRYSLNQIRKLHGSEEIDTEQLVYIS